MSLPNRVSNSEYKLGNSSLYAPLLFPVFLSSGFFLRLQCNKLKNFPFSIVPIVAGSFLATHLTCKLLDLKQYDLYYQQEIDRIKCDQKIFTE